MRQNSCKPSPTDCPKKATKTGKKFSFEKSLKTKLGSDGLGTITKLYQFASARSTGDNCGGSSSSNSSSSGSNNMDNNWQTK